MDNINSLDEINEYFDSLDYEFSEEFENEDSDEIDESENEDSEENEESEKEDSEVSETAQNDVSGNTTNETSESSGEFSFQPHINFENDYLDYVQSEISDPSSLDYSIALEDLKTVGIFLIALILGLFLGLAFIKGFSNNER